MALSNSRKGIVFSTDAIIASVIFLFILTAVLTTWNYRIEKSSRIQQRNSLEIASRNLMKSLIETPGDPKNWQNFPKEAKSIGLTSQQPNLIQKNKLEALNYTQLKKVAFNEKYDFLLEVYPYNNGFNSTPMYSIGVSPANANEIVVVNRIALLNNKYTKFILKGWLND